MDDTHLIELLDTLAEAELTLALAESLTGGALCARLVDVPKASRVLRGGVCTYATPLKAKLLGVDSTLLAEIGPVDAEVARQMAQGARRLMGAELALSTTGVAGPGPAEGHEAGTVHIALAWSKGVVHRELHLTGDRAHIRSGTVNAALELLKETLESGGILDSD